MTMTLIELIRNRQSVRRYAPIPVEPDKISQCLEAVRLAPSANNAQPWKFIVVNEEPLRTRVAEATFSSAVKFNSFTLQAPVLVVIVLRKTSVLTRFAMLMKKKEWRLMDIGIAAEHFCLQAAELGLGTCMLGWFQEDKLKQLLGIPAGESVALVISMGYAVEGYPLRTKVRKPVEDITGYNGFGNE
jgi:nitroreductase